MSVNFDVIEIIEEAYEQIGTTSKNAWDFETARKSIALLNMEWANKGYNAWTVEELVIPVVAGTSTYDLDADTIDLLDCSIQLSNGQSTPVERRPLTAYSKVTNKNQSSSIPSMCVIERLVDKTQLRLWPVPSRDTNLAVWRIRRMKDKANTENADVPFRFLPAYIAGLAARLAAKSKNPDIFARVGYLKGEADRLFAEAEYEDRDKSTYRMRPGRMRVV